MNGKNLRHPAPILWHPSCSRHRDSLQPPLVWWPWALCYCSLRGLCFVSPPLLSDLGVFIGVCVYCLNVPGWDDTGKLGRVPGTQIQIERRCEVKRGCRRGGRKDQPLSVGSWVLGNGTAGLKVSQQPQSLPGLSPPSSSSQPDISSPSTMLVPTLPPELSLGVYQLCFQQFPGNALPLSSPLIPSQLENRFIKMYVRQQSPKQAQAVAIYTHKYVSLHAKLLYRKMFIFKKELSSLLISQDNFSHRWSSAPPRSGTSSLLEESLQEHLGTFQTLVHIIQQTPQVSVW